MASRNALAAVFLVACGLSASTAWATDRTWSGNTNTNWNNTNNWVGGVLPGVNDRAIIPSAPAGGRMPTLNVNATIGQIQIQTGATVNSNGNTLTLNGTTTGGGATSPVLQGPGVFSGTGTVTITGGTNNGIAISTTTTLPNFNFALTTAGNTLGITSGATVTCNGNVNVSAGALQVGDAAGAASTLDINGNLTVGGTLGMRAAASQMRLTGNLTFTGTFTPGTSTLTLDGTANMTMTLANANYQFNHLTITKDAGGNQVDGDLITPNNGFTVNGNLLITRGQFQVGAFTVTVNGNVTSGTSAQSQLDFTNTGLFRCRGNVDIASLSQINTQVGGPYATIQLDGTLVQTFQLRATTASAYFDLDQLQISNTAGVIVLDNPNADFTVNGQLTIDAGCSLTVRDVFDPESPLIMGANSTLRLENIIAADSTIMGSTFTTGVGSTVVYAGQSIAQTVYTQVNSGAQILYHNLTIDNTGGVLATEQTTNTLAVLGSFTISATGNFVSSANGMAVSQNFVDNGTFTHNNGTVAMNGTGSISGTAASLIFNNLTINGALTTDVVTAARNFTTNNLFRVFNGSLTTAGAAAPITMTASQNVTVGDAAGAAGTASFNLRGTDTLALATTRQFAVLSPDGRFTSLGNAPFTNGPAGNPTLTRSGGAGNFTTDISGQVNLMGLNFSFGGANGLYLHNAAIERLRNVRFTNILAGAGSRHLTVDNAALTDLDCPGCMFDTVAATQFNVVATGAAHRLRFEQRSASNAAGSIGGPGAGDSFDGDDDTNGNGVIAAPEVVTATFDGSIVQWVYTANIDMTGAIQGFPEVAFNWNTFAYSSTYMVMRQIAGSSDILYVADVNGDLKGYSFSPGAAAGNIVGPLFWDTEGATQVLYFGTTTGLVYKLIDTGAALTTAPAPWNTPYSNGTLLCVTTPIMSDQTNLYFGGCTSATPLVSGNYQMYRIVISSKTQVIGAINLGRAALTNASSWGDTTGGRMVFQASGALTGVSSIYRIRTTSWVIDTQVNSTSSFTAPTNVPRDTLFVGETNGRMHAVSALGTAAQFTERTGFPFTVNASAVNGGAVWEAINIARQPALTGGRLVFGAANGDIYVLYPYTATWTLNTNYYRIIAGAGAAQSMPLLEGGLMYVSTAGGKLLVYDADTGAGPALTTTYNLFNSASAGDISRDGASSGRIYVGTSGARMYAITPPGDPTAAFP